MFWGVDIGQFAARQGARISLLISIHKVAKTMTSARPGTGDSLRNSARCLGNLVSVAPRTSTHTASFAALCPFVKLDGMRT